MIRASQACDPGSMAVKFRKKFMAGKSRLPYLILTDSEKDLNRGLLGFYIYSKMKKVKDYDELAKLSQEVSNKYKDLSTNYNTLNSQCSQLVTQCQIVAQQLTQCKQQLGQTSSLDALMKLFSLLS